MTDPTDQCLAKDRRPGESAKAFQAARLYFEMGPDRSQRAVATRLGKQPSQIQKWAKQWEWTERAYEHDHHLVSEAQLVLINRARENASVWAHRKEEHREKSFQLSQKLTAKAEQMLAYPLATTTTKDGITSVQPAKWSFRDAPNLLTAAAKLSEQAFQEDDAESLLRDEAFIIEDYKPDVIN